MNDNLYLLENSLWEDLNLKTFFMFLSLQHPEVKQSDIAKDLGITPATLSRVINGTYGDGKMRPEWIQVLAPYLRSLDTQSLSLELQTIEKICDLYTSEDRHRVILDVFSRAPYFDNWYYNNNWTERDSFLFYGENDAAWFLFNLSAKEDITSQMVDIIRRHKGYMNLDKNNRFSFLCYDETTFKECIAFLESNLGNHFLTKNNVRFSAIHASMENACFLKEYFAYPED